jgi:hypothetical protein
MVALPGPGSGEPGRLPQDSIILPQSPGTVHYLRKAYENRLDYGQMQHRDRHSIEDILGRLPAIYQDKRLMVLRLMSKLVYKLMQRISDL